MEFYVPSTLSSDFSDMLNTFGTSVTVNYNSVTPTSAIVQLSRKSTQNTFQNLNDNGRTLRFKLTDTIIKGDYLTDTANNITYIVSYNPYKDINSYRSQAQLTNCQLNFIRWSEAQLDDLGNTATPAGYLPIANNFDCFTSRTGMGIFDSGMNQIGIIPEGSMMVGLQYNTTTALIQIGDEFSYRNIQYTVEDLDYSQLSDDSNTGLLISFSKKRPGGSRITT